MRGLICLSLILILAGQPTRGNDPQSPASLVRGKLAAATAVKERLTAELVRGYDEIKAAGVAGPDRTAREEAVEARYWAAITPAVAAVLAAAEEHPDDPASVEGLDFVALSSRGLTTGQAERALAALLRDHVRAPNISTATRALFVHHDKPDAIALLRAVVADNPSQTERGRACHDLAWTLMFQADRVDRVRAGSSSTALPRHLIDADTTSLRNEAEALYDRCVAEFAAIPVIGYGAGKTVGDFARGSLADIRHLRVGEPAPEIAGVDVDGHPLRLTDYRGKLVVLVFSGEWCGPCRGSAAFFRDLLRPEAQEKAPCVVLEVNTDATRDPVRQAIKAGEIAWPCWFDGGVTGPITMAWGIASFPTIHIIDAQGVLRAKDVLGKNTAATVARVLADHPAEPRP